MLRTISNILYIIFIFYISYIILEFIVFYILFHLISDLKTESPTLIIRMTFHLTHSASHVFKFANFPKRGLFCFAPGSDVSIRPMSLSFDREAVEVAARLI